MSFGDDTLACAPANKKDAARDPLLVERQSTHGSFAQNAAISQWLKRGFKDYLGGDTMLTDIQQEALDMIALKISRILSGHAHFKDHWDDIAGYARLAAEELAAKVKSDGA